MFKKRDPNRTSQGCTKCGIRKSINSFRTHTQGFKYSECKSCQNERNISWSKKHPDKRKRYNRVTRLRNQFGISIEQYDKLLQEQNGVCVICGKKETDKNQWGIKRLSVDHNHLTGKVRGLLCCKCNRAMGLLGDDVSILLAMINYLITTTG